MNTTRPSRSASQLRSVCTLVILIASTLAVGCATTPAKQADVGDKVFSFWPQFPSEPHVQFLAAYRYSSDIDLKKSKFEDLVYGQDSSVLPINKPYGIEMWNGRIYVCDIRNPGVVVLDLAKHQTRIMTTKGLGGMAQPTDIAIASDGTKYVADVVRGVIFVFDADERHIKSFGHKGFKPVGIAVHEGELYVCDFASQSVLVMDRYDGTQLRTIGSPGGEDGQFIRPLGIDVDNEGYVYVTDVLKCRLQRFDPQGNLVSAVGQIGDTAGSFVRPKHLAVDDDGIVYVADAAFDNVQMFNDQGQVLMFFGSGGAHPGAMNLPAGVATTKDDIEIFREYIHPAFKVDQIVLVTNQFGPNKIGVFAVGNLKKGMSIDDIASSLSNIPAGVQEEDEANVLTDDIPELKGDLPESDSQSVPENQDSP